MTHEDWQLRQLTSKEKALQLNLRSEVYGTFAEIGAGQEVASVFFKAGLASGSIAKTMSAYDMTFSDAIYGTCERYVSRSRLDHMLKKEYNLLTKRLISRAKRTTFFVFADTIFTSSDEEKLAHGWIGIRFQLHPNSPPNDCVIHVLLRDMDARWQQETVGVVGVNLLYACYFLSDPELFIRSLKDNLQRGSIEIDMFQLSGQSFAHIDNRVMSLKLVKNGLTKAVMFDPGGNVIQPIEALYKRDVLLLRGRFKPITHVSVDMMLGATKKFRQSPQVDKSRLILLSELTLKDLTDHGEIDEHDFLDRIDLLCLLGQHVIISNYFMYYRLSTYISQCNQGRCVGIIMGYNNLLRIFDEKYYEERRGGLLEAMGSLFGTNATLYIYPCLGEDGKLRTTKEVDLKEHQQLFAYLHEHGRIVDIPVNNVQNLSIISDDVLRMLQTGEEGWERFVPRKVASAIKTNCFFEYPKEVEIDNED